jgi:hypothetical protein
MPIILSHGTLDAQVRRFSLAGLSTVQFVSTAKAIEPIQEPITGSEDLGDLSQPQQALAQFYKAFNTRDLKMIDENFSPSDDVAIDNPLGGIRRGADEPHKMYAGIFKSPAHVHVNFGIYHSSRWRCALGRMVGTRHVL